MVVRTGVYPERSRGTKLFIILIYYLKHKAHGLSLSVAEPSLALKGKGEANGINRVLEVEESRSD